MARQKSHPLRVHPLEGVDPLKDASRGERLQRVLADAGVASRRACEDLIKQGHVAVNGRVITDLPCWVDPANDRITVKGRPLRPAAEHVYIMLNKPTRTLSAASDEPGADRTTVLDLVRHHSGARLFPVGRLDYDTTGLLLLTNDGDLAHKLTHPRFGGLRVYDAIVAGIVPPRTLEELNRRVRGKNRPADAPPPIQIQGFDDGRTLLRITVTESRGRTVQDLLAKLGHHVKHLDRVAFGPLTLTGIARGQWRELDRREVAALKRGQAEPAEAPRPPRKPAPSRRSGSRPKPPGRPGKPPAGKPHTTGKADTGRAPQGHRGPSQPSKKGPSTKGRTGGNTPRSSSNRRRRNPE